MQIISKCSFYCGWVILSSLGGWPAGAPSSVQHPPPTQHLGSPEKKKRKDFTLSDMFNSFLKRLLLFPLNALLLTVAPFLFCFITEPFSLSDLQQTLVLVHCAAIVKLKWDLKASIVYTNGQGPSPFWFLLWYFHLLSHQHITLDVLVFYGHLYLNLLLYCIMPDINDLRCKIIYKQSYNLSCTWTSRNGG